MITLNGAETPVTAMLKTGKRPENVKFNYPLDDYAATSTAGIPDGTDITSADYEDHTSTRKSVDGVVQHWRRVPAVSTFAEKVSNAPGVKNNQANDKEYAMAQVKKTKELGRDIEATILSTNESDYEGDLGAANKTRGMGKWLQSGAQIHLPVNAALRTKAAAIKIKAVATVTEDDINDIMQTIWSDKGTTGNFTLICNPALKRKFTYFATADTQSATVIPVRQFNHDGASKKITMTVTMYEGDFGQLTLLPSRHMVSGENGYLIDKDYWELRWTQKPDHRELENRGAGRRGIVDAIGALACLHPQSAGAFRDL